MFYLGVCLLAAVCLWLLGRERATVRRILPTADNIYGLFSSLSGGPWEIVRNCNADTQMRFVAKGQVLLLMGMLAGAGMGVSFYTFTESAAIAIAVGVFWMLTILSIDRLLLATVNKFDAPWKTWLKALPRLIMVAALSYVVSHTLLFVIYHNDIERKLDSLRDSQEAALVVGEKNSIQTAEDRIKAINQELTGINKEITEAGALLADEVAGKVGEGLSGVPTYGSTARMIEMRIEQAKNLRDELTHERNKLKEEIAQSKQAMDKKIKSKEGVYRSKAGLLDRAQAVSLLCAENAEARWLNRALQIGLFFLEILVLLVELLSPASGLDYWREQERKASEASQKFLDLVFRMVADGTFEERHFQSPTLIKIWHDIEHRICAGLWTVHDGQPANRAAQGECSVTIYLSEPGHQSEQQRLFVTFHTAKVDVTGAHLVKALVQAGAKQDYDLFNWLSLDHFELLNSRGEAIQIAEPLFPQLQNDTVFAVPVLR